MFNNEFNSAFGYPRTDTCATCDEFQIKIKSMSAEKDRDEIRKLTIMNDLHKRKAETFYCRKREAKRAAKKLTKRKPSALILQKIFPSRKLSQMTYIINGSYPCMLLTFMFFLLVGRYFILITRESLKKDEMKWLLFSSISSILT